MRATTRLLSAVHIFCLKLVINWKLYKWRSVESDRRKGMTGPACFHRRTSVGIKESHAPSQRQSRSLEVLIAVTPLAPMLIVGAIWRTPGCKLQDLTFSRKLTHARKVKAWGKGRSCLYNNDQYWVMRMVHLAGIEPCTLRRVAWVVRDQRLTDGSKECGSFIHRAKVFFSYVTLKKDTPRSVEILVISYQSTRTNRPENSNF